MDLDSIIYIVIAIVLAIINAVAQKKKKAAKQPTPQPNTYLMEEETDIVSPPEVKETTPVVELQDILQKIAAEASLFEEPKSMVESKEEISYEQPLDVPVSVLEDSSAIIDTPAAANQYVPLDIPETIDTPTGSLDAITGYDYNSHALEGSIESSAITDALTEEEELELKKSKWSEFKKHFSPKDAILYSEIIKPKYFSINPNY